MDAHTVLAEIEEMSAYALANMADTHAEHDGSAGAKWLTGIRDAVVERYDWFRSSDGMDDDHDRAVERVRDDAHELADSAVPVYTDDRMAVMVETRAYHEDVSEFASGIGSQTVVDLAALALYIVAERLVFALCDAMEPLGDAVEGCGHCEAGEPMVHNHESSDQ